MKKRHRELQRRLKTDIVSDSYENSDYQVQILRRLITEQSKNSAANVMDLMEQDLPINDEGGRFLWSLTDSAKIYDHFIYIKFCFTTNSYSELFRLGFNRSVQYNCTFCRIVDGGHVCAHIGRNCSPSIIVYL